MSLTLCTLVGLLLCIARTPASGSPLPPSSQGAKAVLQTWSWTDFEVVGQRSVEREDLIGAVPLELGSEYRFDRAQADEWELDLAGEFDLFRVKVGAVRYADGNAYLLIDVVEHGEEDRLTFRDTPTGSFDLPEDVVRAHAELQVLWDQLFEEGKPPAEIVTEDYLDFRHDRMQQLAAKIRRVAGEHRELLVAALREDARSSVRADAASLLNWAGHPEQSIREVYSLVNDPDGTTRNNLTRFMLHFLDRVEAPETRQAIIEAMAWQLRRPSHADRNKSLYALLRLVEKNPADLTAVMAAAGDSIRLISKQSILSNVRDPAQQLLANRSSKVSD
jgi:RNAse (barnase) inhibitor barstar